MTEVAEGFIPLNEVRIRPPDLIGLNLQELLLTDGNSEAVLENKAGSYKFKSFEVPGVDKNEHFVILGMWDAIGGNAIGHMDIRVNKTEKRAYLVASPLSGLSEVQRNQLPEDCNRLITEFEPKQVEGWGAIILDDSIVNAMELKREYQGLGLGRLQLILGRAVLEAQGISELQIEDDQTKSGGREGFYSKSGAVDRVLVKPDGGRKTVQVIPNKLSERDLEIVRSYGKV